MSKRSLIDSIEVKKACSEDWDAMTGGERVRFCSHRALEVNNLSALTRKQAMRLVNASGGRICVRYVKNPVDNSPVFAGRKLYQITRRASLAAGVLSASLSLSALAFAQNEPIPVKRDSRSVLVEQKEPDKPQPDGLAESFSVNVYDSYRAVVPNAVVTLTNLRTNVTRTVTADAEGFLKFENVPSARYRIRASANGFKEDVREMDVFDGEESGTELVLEPSDDPQMITMGDIAFVSYSTQLAAAVSGDDLERVRNLIARGEDVNAKEKNFSHITPLFLAVENGSAEIAETLLNFGARVNAKDDNRQTPLMRLDEDAEVGLVNLLIKHGARVNLTDKEGNTALIFAARSAKAEVLQILITRAADIDASNAMGRTALMEAADADNLENVRTLLRAGADARLKDNEGETAFDLTTDEEIKKLLGSYGADVENNSR